MMSLWNIPLRRLSRDVSKKIRRAFHENGYARSWLIPVKNGCGSIAEGMTARAAKQAMTSMRKRRDELVARCFVCGCRIGDGAIVSTPLDFRSEPGVEGQVEVAGRNFASGAGLRRSISWIVCSTMDAAFRISTRNARCSWSLRDRAAFPAPLPPGVVSHTRCSGPKPWLSA